MRAVADEVLQYNLPQFFKDRNQNKNKAIDSYKLLSSLLLSVLRTPRSTSSREFVEHSGRFLQILAGGKLPVDVGRQIWPSGI